MIASELVPTLAADGVVRLGTDLVVRGQVVVQIDVDTLAPNDIVATPAEADRIQRDRDTYALDRERVRPAGRRRAHH